MTLAPILHCVTGKTHTVLSDSLTELCGSQVACWAKARHNSDTQEGRQSTHTVNTENGTLDLVGQT